MDYFSKFCNICYSQEKENLTDISGKDLLFKLLALIGVSEFQSANVYLCTSCCEKLSDFFQFRFMCIQNLVQFRQQYFVLKANLEEKEDAGVCSKLKAFIEQHVFNIKVVDEIENLDDVDSSDSVAFVCDVDTDETKIEDSVEQDNCKKENRQVVMGEEKKSATEDFEINEDENKAEDELSINDIVLDYVDAENFQKSLDVDKSIQIEFLKFDDDDEKSNISINDFLQQDLLELQQFQSYDETKNVNTETDLNFGNSLSESMNDTFLRQWKCSVCKQLFSDEILFAIHMSIHRNSEPLRCFVCNITFPTLQKIEEHKREKRKGPPFHCCKCWKTFTYFQNLQYHQRVHTGLGCYTCKYCNKSFSRLLHLVGHERKHTGAKPYQCEICKRRYRHTSSLNYHYQKAHLIAKTDSSIDKGNQKRRKHKKQEELKTKIPVLSTVPVVATIVKPPSTELTTKVTQ